MSLASSSDLLLHLSTPPFPSVSCRPLTPRSQETHQSLASCSKKQSLRTHRSLGLQSPAMVQRKEPRRKPKAPPELTPEPKGKKGSRQEDGVQEPSGGAKLAVTAMAPAAAAAKGSPLPHYMRATSSSDAKTGRRRGATPGSGASGGGARRKAAVRVSKGKVLFAKLDAARATCSSAMKDAKFPGALELAPGGTEAEGASAARVCPYTYCSLNGHAHAPPVPLRSFLASRRRLIKTQESMKLKGVSPFRRKTTSTSPCKDEEGGCGAKIAPLIEEAVNDFFVEIYESPRVEFPAEGVELKGCDGDGERVSSDISCSELSLEEIDAMLKRLKYATFDRWCAGGEEKGKDFEAAKGSGADMGGNFDTYRDNGSDSSEFSDCDRITGDLVELSGMNYQGYTSAEDGGDVDADEDDVLGHGCNREIPEEKEGRDDERIVDVVCGVEICGEKEANDEQKNIADISEEEKDEENIPDVGCEEETSGEQQTNDVEYFDAVSDNKLKISEEGEARDGDIIPDIGEETPEEQEATEEETIRDIGEEQTSVEQEANDAENFSNLASCKLETSEEEEAKDGEGIGEVSSAEAASDEQAATLHFSLFISLNISGSIVVLPGDQDTPDEENMSNVACRMEDSMEQTIEEEHKFSDADSKVEIPEETSSGVGCEADFSEEMSNVACRMEDSKEQTIKEERKISDTDPKLEIPEKTSSDVGCEADFSEEINSSGVSKGEASELVCLNALNTLDFEIEKPIEDGDGIEHYHNTVHGHYNAEECGVAQETGSFSPNAQLPECGGSCDIGEDHGRPRSNPGAEGGNSDAGETSIDDICGAFSGMSLKGDVCQDGISDAGESSIDDICGAFSGMSLKGDVCPDPIGAAGCQRNRMIIARRRRTPEELEYMRGFNPRAPNFLPAELDPEAEKVDLRHQLVDERKNAEEWMIDYALRRAVTSLAPARKKKVKLLVQAFETVLPPPACEKPMHEDDKKSFSPARPIQACN